MPLDYLGAPPVASDRQARPFSPAVRAGDFIYVSGQVPANAEGEIVAGGIEAQTRQVMTNIKNILAAGGATMDHVVKSTVHLANLDDFQAFNAVYKEFFTAPFPVRTTVGSALLGGILVEIDVVAALPQAD